MTYHITHSNLKQYFLTILAKKDYSVAELIKKAHIKGVSGSEIKEVIAWLEEAGYVNDKRFADMLVHHYKNTKGSRWIKIKLQQKLIPDHIINEALASIVDSTTDEIKHKVESKYGVNNWSDVDSKVLGKIVNYLARQGYMHPFDMINEWKKSE